MLEVWQPMESGHTWGSLDREMVRQVDHVEKITSGPMQGCGLFPSRLQLEGQKPDVPSQGHTFHL